jgi:hypothetical protein
MAAGSSCIHLEKEARDHSSPLVSSGSVACRCWSLASTLAAGGGASGSVTTATTCSTDRLGVGVAAEAAVDGGDGLETHGELELGALAVVLVWQASPDVGRRPSAAGDG